MRSINLHYITRPLLKRIGIGYVSCKWVDLWCLNLVKLLILTVDSKKIGVSVSVENGVLGLTLVNIKTCKKFFLNWREKLFISVNSKLWIVVHSTGWSSSEASLLFPRQSSELRSLICCLSEEEVASKIAKGRTRNYLCLCDMFVCSEQATVRSVVAKLVRGFVMSDSVVDSTTHIVCGGSRRTMKLLMGIARGCWIMSLDWVCHVYPEKPTRPFRFYREAPNFGHLIQPSDSLSENPNCLGTVSS